MRRSGFRRDSATFRERLTAAQEQRLSPRTHSDPMLEDLGGCDVRVSKSQVAFRRRRGFAYLWLPGQYLTHPAAEVVLSIPLGRHDGSPRWKEVAHPSPTAWMHHLEVRSPGELDDEVAAWLREAWSAAG